MRALVVLGALLALLGCDRTGELRPGVSTAAEVRAKMGEPTMEWREGDSRVWEYPFTPEGTRNYMLTIGPDDVLRAMDQVLTPENFARVQAGMTRDEVRRLLGKPASVVVFERKGEEVWDWKLPSLPATISRFNVHFGVNDGRVTTTSKTEQSLG